MVRLKPTLSIKQRFITQLRALGRSCEGVALIEFSIISMVLIVLVMAIIEYSIIMFYSSVIETATIASAMEGKKGSSSTAIMTAFKNSVGIFDPSTDTTVHLCVVDNTAGGTTPTTCTANSFASGNGTSVGNANDVMSYTATYQWQVFSPALYPFFDNQTVNISSTFTIKNEPF